MSDDGNIKHQAEGMADIFAAAFSSVYVQGALDHPELHQTFEGSIGCIDIIIDSVMAVLSDLDVSSSMGPDEFHPCLLKSCKTELAYPLW